MIDWAPSPPAPGLFGAMASPYGARMVSRPERCLVRRPWGGRGALFVGALALASCVDPTARFDEFVAREEAASMPPGGHGDPAPDAGFVLPTPEQSAGNFLLAVSTGLGRTKPVVSLLEVEAADMDGRLELRLRYRPLAASDRKTPVGEFNEWQSR